LRRCQTTFGQKLGKKKERVKRAALI